MSGPTLTIDMLIETLMGAARDTYAKGDATTEVPAYLFVLNRDGEIGMGPVHSDSPEAQRAGLRAVFEHQARLGARMLAFISEAWSTTPEARLRTGIDRIRDMHPEDRTEQLILQIGTPAETVVVSYPISRQGPKVVLGDVMDSRKIGGRVAALDDLPWSWRACDAHDQAGSDPS